METLNHYGFGYSYVLNVSPEQTFMQLLQHPYFIPSMLTACIGLLLLLLFSSIRENRRRIHRKGRWPMAEFIRFRMARKDRGKYLRDLVEWVITDGIEDAYVDGKITLSEKNELYEQFARKMKLYGLLPQKRKDDKLHWRAANQLHDEIEDRLKSGAYDKPAPIPGDPPPDVVVHQAKTVLGGIFARKLKTA